MKYANVQLAIRMSWSLFPFYVSLFEIICIYDLLYDIFSQGLAEKTHHFTLLDGEMVIDTLPDTQKQERRYLIYDMMALNHVSVIEVGFFDMKPPSFPSWKIYVSYMLRGLLVLFGIMCILLLILCSIILQRPFYERWRMIDKEVIGPRNYERQHIYQSRNPYYRYELEPFRVCLSKLEYIVIFYYYLFCLSGCWFLNVYQVRRKDFFLLSTVTKLLKEFIPKLSHEADGLIFQVLKSTYSELLLVLVLYWISPEELISYIT